MGSPSMDDYFPKGGPVRGTHPSASSQASAGGNGLLDESGIPIFSTTVNPYESDPLRPVQATHVDAAGVKKVCAELGYFDDPWLHHLVPAHTVRRRNPMIHRGYYARVTAMRSVVRSFIENCPKDKRIQIVNLGAGLDTLYFWVREHIYEWGRSFSEFAMFEVDFPEVIAKKTKTVSRNSELLSEEERQMVTSSPLFASTQLEAPTYKLLACDLRQMSDLEATLKQSGFDPENSSTLFLSECVLIYMQTLHGNGIIEGAARMCANAQANGCLASFATYEQCNPDTKFGAEMVRNLHARGCPLLSIHDVPHKEDQEARYRERGWSMVTAWGMNEVSKTLTSEEEMMRVARLELLDEVEELNLIQEHYFVLVATNGVSEPRYANVN